MKTALWTILALVAGYIFLVGPQLGKKDKEAELFREAERQADLNALDRSKKELDKRITLRKEIIRLKKEKDDDLMTAIGSIANAPEPAKSPGKMDASGKTGDLPGAFQQYSDKLIIIKSNTGAGSGFVCEIGGKSVAITNAHVISGAKQLKFLKPDGRPVEVIADQLQVAMDRDLVFFPLKSQQANLKLAPGGKLTIGETVVCLGNSGGESVITDVRGEVLGIGGDTFEVDADVIQGNSGCPVITVGSGEVLGVVTRAEQKEKNWVSKGTRFDKARRFCLKIEGAHWKQIGWVPFAAEATLVENYQSHRQKLDALVEDLASGAINPTGYESSSVSIRSAVREFIAAAANPTLGHSDKLKASASFLRQVEFEIRKGPFDSIEDMRVKAGAMCAYHKNSLTSEITLRETLSARIKAAGGAVITIADMPKRR